MDLSAIIISLNLDTVERILAFATLLLRKLNLTAGIDASFPYKNSVRISPAIIRNTDAEIEGKLSIEASLLYDSILFLGKGGNLYAAINRYTNLTDYTSNFICPPTTDNFNLITNLPFYISSPEQLFYWVAQVLFLSLPPDQKVINFQILEENSNGAIVKITFDLPFDYYKFIRKGNLVEALTRVVSTYTFPVGNLSGLSVNSDFTNNSSIDNSFVLGN